MTVFSAFARWTGNGRTKSERSGEILRRAWKNTSWACYCWCTPSLFTAWPASPATAIVMHGKKNSNQETGPTARPTNWSKSAYFSLPLRLLSHGESLLRHFFTVPTMCYSVEASRRLQICEQIRWVLSSPFSLPLFFFLSVRLSLFLCRLVFLFLVSSFGLPLDLFFGFSLLAFICHCFL